MSEVDLAYEVALRIEEQAALPDPGTTRGHPTLRKGLVTSVSPFQVDDLPASNITGLNLDTDQVVWLLVDAGRRLVFGRAFTPVGGHFVKKSGDTMAGTLIIDGGALAATAQVSGSFLRANNVGSTSATAIRIGGMNDFGIYGGATFTGIVSAGAHRIIAYQAATNDGTVWMNGGALNVGPQSSVLHTTTTLNGMSFRNDFLTVSRENTMFVMNQRAGSGTMQSIRQAGTEQGRIRVTAGGTVVFEDTSDERGKRNIRTAKVKNALSKARSLRLTTFQQVEDEEEAAPEAFGVIAQEVAELAPWAVGEGTDVDGSATELGVDYGRLSLLLFPAVEELANRLDSLEAQTPRPPIPGP